MPQGAALARGDRPVAGISIAVVLAVIGVSGVLLTRRKRST